MITNGQKDGTKALNKEMQIKRLEKYKYLGQIVSFKNQMAKEIKTRISITWKAF